MAVRIGRPTPIRPGAVSLAPSPDHLARLPPAQYGIAAVVAVPVDVVADHHHAAVLVRQSRLKYTSFTVTPSAGGGQLQQGAALAVTGTVKT